MTYETFSAGTLSAKQPDGTWRVVGTVGSVEVSDEITRRIVMDGEVLVDMRNGRFVDVADVTVELPGIGALRAGFDLIRKSELRGESVATASKRTSPPWQRRHYGPQK
jgi:hypothetical protein